MLLAGMLLIGAVPAMADEAEETPDFETWDTIVTEDVFDVPIVWDVIPTGYNKIENEHKGTILRPHYTTDAYDDGETHTRMQSGLTIGISCIKCGGMHDFRRTSATFAAVCMIFCTFFDAMHDFDP